MERGNSGRFLEIPHDESRDAYADMEDFIETVTNRRLQDRLSDAIAGRGAFSCFRDVLLDAPDERESWFTFKNDRLRGRVLRWLKGEEIELIPD